MHMHVQLKLHELRGPPKHCLPGLGLLHFWCHRRGRSAVRQMPQQLGPQSPHLAHQPPTAMNRYAQVWCWFPSDAGFSCSVAACAAFAQCKQSWSQLQRSMYNVSHTRGTRCSPLTHPPIHHHQTNTSLTNQQEFRTKGVAHPKGAVCGRKTETTN